MGKENGQSWRLTTQIRESNPAHAKIAVWQSGGLAGTLVVQACFADAIAEALDECGSLHSLKAEVARLTEENQRLRNSVAEFLNYREHGKDYGTLTRLEGNLRAALAPAEEKP